jgi:hypothetical protein
MPYHERIQRDQSNLIPLDPAEDPSRVVQIPLVQFISIRHDDCEKQVFDPAVSGISDGNEPMRDGFLAKCNAFDGAIVRPL